MFLKKYSVVLGLTLFFLGLFLPNAWNPLNRGQAVSAEYQNMDDPYQVLTAYHAKVNDIFNSALELNSNPKAYHHTSLSECDNPSSTYCLAMILNDELLKAQTVLYRMKDTFIAVDPSLNTTTQQSIVQKNMLAEEIARMEDALDLSLEVYDNFQFIYPLHLQLVGEKGRDTTSIRAELEDNIRGLERLRRLFEYYPHAFQDVTSLSCQ